MWNPTDHFAKPLTLNSDSSIIAWNGGPVTLSCFLHMLKWCAWESSKSDTWHLKSLKGDVCFRPVQNQKHKSRSVRNV